MTMKINAIDNTGDKEIRHELALYVDGLLFTGCAFRCGYSYLSLI